MSGRVRNCLTVDVEVVANEARAIPISCGISTSLAFGGNNAALVMKRFD